MRRHMVKPVQHVFEFNTRWYTLAFIYLEMVISNSRISILRQTHERPASWFLS